MTTKKLPAKQNRVKPISKKLTPPELRVKIAEHALMSIGDKRLNAITNAFLTHPKREEVARRQDIGKDLKDVLKHETKCEACAVGGLFYAAVTLYNEYPVTKESRQTSGEEIGGENVFGYLEKYFDRNQLSLIEYAYENGEGAISRSNLAWYYDITSEQLDLAEEFYRLFPDDAERFSRIMENIIRNKGQFELQSKTIVF